MGTGHAGYKQCIVYLSRHYQECGEGEPGEGLFFRGLPGIMMSAFVSCLKYKLSEDRGQVPPFIMLHGSPRSLLPFWEGQRPFPGAV